MQGFDLGPRSSPASRITMLQALGTHALFICCTTSSATVAAWQQPDGATEPTLAASLTYTLSSAVTASGSGGEQEAEEVTLTVSAQTKSRLFLLHVLPVLPSLMHGKHRTHLNPRGQVAALALTCAALQPLLLFVQPNTPQDKEEWDAVLSAACQHLAGGPAELQHLIKQSGESSCCMRVMVGCGGEAHSASVYGVGTVVGSNQVNKLGGRSLVIGQLSMT